MERAIVVKPHGLSASACTTTSASTASSRAMISRTETSATQPAKGLISSLAICPSDLPLRRIEAKRITKSCTAPASTTPTMIQRVPGRKPNCAASTGPTSGPAPAIAAKWWPSRTQRLVGTKSRPLSIFSAGVARESSRPTTRAAIQRL